MVLFVQYIFVTNVLARHRCAAEGRVVPATHFCCCCCAVRDNDVDVDVDVDVDSINAVDLTSLPSCVDVAELQIWLVRQ